MGTGAEGQTSRQKHGANSIEAAADKRAGCAFENVRMHWNCNIDI